MTVDTDFVTVAVRGVTGHISLNRPKALNALNPAMIGVIDAALEQWAGDDAVTRVLITSTSPKAFCAGGDIRAVAEQARAGGDTTSFFTGEYRMNQRIADYPKPVISLIDGVNMGGGVGVSIHGSHRVVTEKAVIAMPEVAIGFIPDVGSTYLLSRLPAGVGELMAMTAARLSAADALAVGLATHFVPSTAIAELERAILDGAELDAAVQQFAVTAPLSDLPLAQIREVFGLDSVPTIVAALSAAQGEWAESARDRLETACPTSVFVSFELVRLAGGGVVADALARELVVGERMIARPDFVEGIRAVLVDKTRDAAFVPATLAEVDPTEIAAIVR